MYKKCSIVLVILITFLSCNVGAKKVEEATHRLCECYRNYDESNRQRIEFTIRCNDSLVDDGLLDYIPKKKLIKQLQKDCPETAKLIEKGL